MQNGVSRREEGRRMAEIFEAIMTGKFPRLMSNTKPQEAQRTPGKVNVKRTIPKHIIFKLQKRPKKKFFLKKPEEKNAFPLEKQR